ncbi:Uncharacterised protein [Streptococcus pneumoniae]|nr:Uncharacterised protein [Streptococcus pneumoniae]
MTRLGSEFLKALDSYERPVLGYMTLRQLVLLFGIALTVVVTTIKLLILLRSFTLYTYKGIAKIIVACYMVDSLRPICLGFFKLYVAAVLQGLILVVIIMLYPAIVTNDLLTVDKTGAWTSALVAIAKGIIYIIMLFGSQRMAKNIMQVN